MGYKRSHSTPITSGNQEYNEKNETKLQWQKVCTPTTGAIARLRSLHEGGRQ
jgi:hypothetical protein